MTTPYIWNNVNAKRGERPTIPAGLDYQGRYPTREPDDNAAKGIMLAVIAGLSIWCVLALVAVLIARSVMDTDDKTCGTCRHGRFYDRCAACEDIAEAMREQYEREQIATAQSEAFSNMED